MFCPNCGKANLDDSNFCEDCGTLLVDNTVAFDQSGAPAYPEATDETPAAPAAPPFTMPEIDIKKFFNEKKTIIIPVLAAIVAVVAFMIVGSSLSSPDRVAKKYFKAVTTNDYEAIYESLAVPDNEIINKDSFVKYMEADYEANGNSFEGVTNYKVEQLRTQQSNMSAGGGFNLFGDKNQMTSQQSDEKPDDRTLEYEVSIVDRMTGNESTHQLILVKQEKKVLFFFDTYKVSSKDYIVTNVVIRTDKKGTMKIDGAATKVKPRKIDNYYTYTFSAFYKGEHKLEFVTDLFDTYKTSFSTYNSNEELNFDPDLILKESIQTQLKDKANEDYVAFYTTALNQKNFSSLNIACTDDFKDNLKDRYNSVKESLVRNEVDGTGINTLTFTDYEFSSSYSYPVTYEYNSDKLLVASLSLTISYDYNATEDQGWFETEIVTFDESGDVSPSFSYTYDDGQWKMSGLGSYNIRF